MKKSDVVNLLAGKHGYSSYLEIATPRSGLTYGDIDRNQLTSCERLLYCCQEEFSDGLPIDFRTPIDTSADLVRTMIDGKIGHHPYDVVFVDSHHTYRASMEDILGGYCLTRPGGMLVVHDCRPEDKSLVTPEFRQGPWCGVSYQAYVDFTLPRRHLTAFTVDCDFGCGVIFKPDHSSAARDRMEFDWYCARRNEAHAFEFFGHHPGELLRLTSVREFVRDHELKWNSLKAAVSESVRSIAKFTRR